MKPKNIRKFPRILLSLVLVLVLMPGMGLAAHASDPFSSLKNTTTVVKFDNKDWYLIDYDESTVTLLSKECVGASVFGSNSMYRGSAVEAVVNTYYTDHISEEAKTAVNGDGMFLLSTEQAWAVKSENPDVLKCSQARGATYNYWWLGSSGYFDFIAAYAYGFLGDVFDLGTFVDISLGVRPAIQLNLSAVAFSPTDNTFIAGTGSVNRVE